MSGNTFVKRMSGVFPMTAKIPSFICTNLRQGIRLSSSLEGMPKLWAVIVSSRRCSTGAMAAGLSLSLAWFCLMP
jgi:hypothetical protein